MFQGIPFKWLAFVPAVVALGVFAQIPAGSQQPRPQPSPAAAQPYRSTLEGYQAFGDDALVPWKQANDTVRQVGGWRAYAREASGAAADQRGAGPAKPAEAHPHGAH